MIVFRFRPVKAIEAITWMLQEAKSDQERPLNQLDFHTILKTCYFADKRALNELGRPIFGAKYIAMQYGPVPREIYEMLKREPMWLSEMLEDGIEDYPWGIDRYFVFLKKGQNVPGECENIACADMPLIEEEFSNCRKMTFTQRTRETHGIDWVMGFERPGKTMYYEDMILETTPDRDKLIENLREIGPYLAL